jgi:hypothetical protein
VTPEEMVIQQISLNDEPLDEFVIPRKQAVASQPVAAAQ